jgi:hypothetical protein
MQCSVCRRANPVDAAFCGECGAPLAVASNGNGTVDGIGSPGAMTDSTRYLCAAVHLESRLADRAVREILDEEFRAPPWSPGVDLALVLRHAVAAQGRQVLRDVALTVALLACVIFFFRQSGGGVAVTLVAAWLIVVVERLAATYGVVARQLGPSSSGGALPAPVFGAEVERRLAAIADTSTSNVSVYGSYSPFIGSGFTVGAWSFALDINRPAAGRQVRPFTAADLHDHVVTSLRQLTLPRVTLDDRVFVDGRDVRNDRRFLESPLARPRSSVDPTLVRALSNAQEDRARSYLCLRVEGWRGQLVLSTFVRFLTTSDKLFVELSRSLLTPVLDKYQEADHLLPQPTFRQLMKLVGRSLRDMPGQALRAPSAVVRALFAPLLRSRNRARRRREINGGLRYNYGSTTSPRERAADPNYQRYFQQLDKELYEKVAERQILMALAAFLDDHGVDTSELVERQTTILNNGVYVTGGAVDVGSMAVGKRARAKSTSSTPAKAGAGSSKEG